MLDNKLQFQLCTDRVAYVVLWTVICSDGWKNLFYPLLDVKRTFSSGLVLCCHRIKEIREVQTRLTLWFCFQLCSGPFPIHYGPFVTKPKLSRSEHMFLSPLSQFKPMVNSPAKFLSHFMTSTNNIGLLKLLGQVILQSTRRSTTVSAVTVEMKILLEN